MKKREKIMVDISFFEDFKTDEEILEELHEQIARIDRWESKLYSFSEMRERTRKMLIEKYA